MRGKQLIGGSARRLKLALNTLVRGEPSGPARREVPAITAEEVAEARKFFPLDKFFVFGHARSGTTLITRLVRLHPEVHCNYQAHFFTRLPLLEGLVADREIERWLSRNSNRWNRGRDLSPVILRAAADFIMERDARREGARVVGDKSPNSLLDGEAVRLLVKVYPDARLLFIVRDGRDTALSHRFQAFIDTPQKLAPEDLRIRQAFAQDPQPFLSGQRSVFTEKILRQSAEGWRRNLAETDRTARSLLEDAYLSVRYEDLLARPWQEMARVWQFLGVDPNAPGLQAAVEAGLQENPDADWQQEKAGEIANPIPKGQAGSWRELFTERDRQVFKAAAGETLIEWGYEKDLNW